MDTRSAASALLTSSREDNVDEAGAVHNPRASARLGAPSSTSKKVAQTRLASARVNLPGRLSVFDPNAKGVEDQSAYLHHDGTHIRQTTGRKSARYNSQSTQQSSTAPDRAPEGTTDPAADCKPIMSPEVSHSLHSISEPHSTRGEHTDAGNTVPNASTSRSQSCQSHLEGCNAVQSGSAASLCTGQSAVPPSALANKSQQPTDSTVNSVLQHPSQAHGDYLLAHSTPATEAIEAATAAATTTAAAGVAAGVTAAAAAAAAAGTVVNAGQPAQPAAQSVQYTFTANLRGSAAQLLDSDSDEELMNRAGGLPMVPGASSAMMRACTSVVDHYCREPLSPTPESEGVNTPSTPQQHTTVGSSFSVDSTLAAASKPAGGFLHRLMSTQRVPPSSSSFTGIQPEPCHTPSSALTVGSTGSNHLRGSFDGPGSSHPLLTTSSSLHARGPTVLGRLASQAGKLLRGQSHKSSPPHEGVLGTFSGVGPDAEVHGEEEAVWYSGLDHFKPLHLKLHRGKYVTAYFACSVHTGEHFVLKEYKKAKLNARAERGVRRALAFGQTVHHPGIVKCCGMWEEDDVLYLVEEYASHGDVLQDSLANPDKYSEQYVALHVVKPLLEVLVALHARCIMHRGIMPENVMMGKDTRLRLGHMHSAINWKLDFPHTRITMLDYMPPEMLAMAIDEDDPALSYLTKQATQALADHHDGSSAAPAGSPGGFADGYRREGSSSATAISNSSSKNSNAMRLAHALFGASNPELSQLKASRNSIKWPAAITAAAKQLGNDVNPWEGHDTYDEKVDIWMLGCLTYELLCGTCPFEVEDRNLTAALILWADIEHYPKHLSPAAVSFLQTAFRKDPSTRPSAAELLQHPWITKGEHAGTHLEARGTGHTQAAGSHESKSQTRVSLLARFGLHMPRPTLVLPEPENAKH